MKTRHLPATLLGLSVIIAAAAACDDKKPVAATTSTASAAPPATAAPTNVPASITRATTDAGAPACPASPTWISSPSLPSDVPVSPSNCDFHQFAWQSFWYLVQPSSTSQGSPLNFETFMPVYDVLVATGKPLPYGTMPPPPQCASANKSGKAAYFKRRVVKPTSGHGVDPDSDKQATGDVLVDQRGNPVYYDQRINQTEYDFINACQLYTKGCLTAADKQQNPAAVQFPAGSIELKTAWRVLPGPDPSFYTTTGLVEEPGSTKCTEVTLGLVGFHLVARTPNHPEFIWATFEHTRNAPDCADLPPAGSPPWSFYDPSCTNCTNNKATSPPTPAQVCRVDPQGGGSSDNVTNIQSINASMRALMPAGSVWRNYVLTGGIWTINQAETVGQIPPSPTNEKGSLLAANMTMETFFQGANQNCFTCHTYDATSQSPVRLSHLMDQIQQEGGCASNVLPPSCPSTTLTKQ